MTTERNVIALRALQHFKLAEACEIAQHSINQMLNGE